MANELRIKISKPTGVITEAFLTAASGISKEAKTGITKGFTFMLAIMQR